MPLRSTLYVMVLEIRVLSYRGILLLLPDHPLSFCLPEAQASCETLVC